MDEEGFKRYLKKIGRSERKIEFDIRNMKNFEEYLLKHKRKKLEEAAPNDLKDFVDWAEETGLKIWLWVFNRYYGYKQNDVMFCALNELLGIQSMKVLKLKDFLGVNRQHVQALKAKGVVTAEQMLDTGLTREGREKLAEKTGVPLDYILELVKLANLSRIPGLKRKRARLYHDAGLDRIEKIAKSDPEEMRQMLAEFVDRKGFDGSAPPIFEAAFSVKLAKYLPRIVEY
ncbi:MAG: DUF4332 domain-containing protein [Candidatus Bathyarchaeota archaeon]|nr:MAG: DUF4332 domain-containing protein [Candidatus Bathyarchaeota archaeon]